MIKTGIKNLIPFNCVDDCQNKATYFRKCFNLKNYKKVLLKITSLGWVKIFLNGNELIDKEFLTGWVDYTKRTLLYIFDITSKVKELNVLGVVLGKGWASGSVEWGALKKYYNLPAPCFYAEIEITDIDGKVTTLENDGWKYGFGAIIENDIMAGETWNYSLDLIDFFTHKYDDKTLKNPNVYNRELLVEENNRLTVSVNDVFDGKLLYNKKGKLLYDFGQNFAGVVGLKVVANNDSVVTVRHGEILDENGDLSFVSLRGAKALDKYILPKGEYRLRPYFTYHGFRYAEIEVQGDVQIISCKGFAIYTDLDIVGSFSTSSNLVNKINSNCVWSIKSNIHYVPTDCPQRDERLGWLGDAGVIIRSLLYQFDAKELVKHYLSCVAEAVREDGAIPSIAPNAKGFLDVAIGASAWADGFLSILSDYYDFYMDKSIIEKYFSVAENFVCWVENNSTNYKRNTYCFSDWLSVNANIKEGYGDVDFNVFDACFYALDCLWMQKFCKILGRDDNEYLLKYIKVKNFFRKNLIKDGQIIGGGKQTAYLLAYKSGFISKEEMSVFIKDVLTNGMTCGFIGVKYILSVLCELGRSDIAYSLISSVDFASWGYSVVNGATTIWERWDSYVKGKGVNSHSMNSFNHFAFGSCLEWFYSCVLGINLDLNINCVIISPFIDCSGKITQVDGSFKSVLGEVKVSWEVKFFAKKTIAFVEVILPKKLSVQFDFSGWNIISKSVKKDKVVFELER